MADFAALLEKSAKKKEEEEVAASSGAAGAATEGEDEGAGEEEESTATFTPLVKLEEVAVSTGEEDETVVYCQRSKLYVYAEAMLDKGTGKKGWLERGIGEMKLLQHNETQRIRVLMRQEQTKKIMANHALDPRLELSPNAGAADKSWVWVAWDFDGKELVETTFALRFGNPDLAKEFKEAFETNQAVMKKVLAGEDDTEGAEEADDAADALAGLSTKEDKGEDKADAATDDDKAAEAPAPAEEG